MIVSKETAPHLRRKATVARMMADVLIALAPTLIFSFVVYPIKTLITLLLSLFIMNASEFVYVGLRNMYPNDGVKRTFKDKFAHSYKGNYTSTNILTASISAVIFTLIMPAGAPIYAVTNTSTPPKSATIASIITSLGPPTPKRISSAATPHSRSST